MNPLHHFTTWWQCWARNSSLYRQCFSQNKMTNGRKNWTLLDNLWNTLGTLWEYIYTLQVVSFLFLVFFGSEKHLKCISCTLCMTHDVISVKQMPPSGRAHPQLHCVKIWSQSDWQFWRYWWFCIPTPCSCSNTARMSTSSTSPDMPPMAYQVPVHVPLPTYNWAASNQMQEFCLFKCQLETWTCIHKIKAEEKLNYLLCILGKEGYAAMDRWVPADEAHKNDPMKFLDYTESTLDKEIFPQVHVYKLEDITKRSDESIDELVDQICQLTCRAQIGNGSDAAIEFEAQCRLIWAIPDTNIKLCKQLLKVSCDKKVLHLLEICRTYYAVESGAAAMCVSHVVHAVCHTCQTHDPKLQTSYALCLNCTHQHPPGRHNCPARDSACKGCGKKGHWQAKCHSSGITSS